MSASADTTIGPFSIRDCALAAIATGVRVQNLKEFHTALVGIHPGCLDYHFWGSRLRPMFDTPLFTNDFAVWARHGLHDHVLAEQLSMVDPSEYAEAEELRQEVLDVVEGRLDESERIPWAKSDQQFHFIRAQMVVFDTHRIIADPRALRDAVASMSIGSIYYHIISARRRYPVGVDDIQAWLRGYGASTEALCFDIAAIDPFFLSLSQLRSTLVSVLEAHQY